MSATTQALPLNPGRRRWFRRIAKGPDPQAPQRAPWHRVDGIAAKDGDVFWSGWAGEHEVFIVGDGGCILHFDARREAAGAPGWQSMRSPTRLPLHDIWGRRRDDLYAVGWMGAVLHFDGTIWRQIRGGSTNAKTQRYEASTVNTPLFAVTGNAQGRIWAAGDGGLILTSPDSAKDRSWAVGEHGLTLVGADDAWKIEPTPLRSNLRDIVCTEAGHLFAVGSYGSFLTSVSDGHWSTITSPIASDFTSIITLSETSVLLGGGRYFADAGSFRGELLRWQDGTFTALEVPADMPRVRALRPYKGGVLIAADRGHLYFLRGSRIDQLHTDTVHDLMHIVPLTSGEALAVGDFSTVMVGTPDFASALTPQATEAPADSQWAWESSNSRSALWNVICASTGIGYACGGSGTVLEHRNDCWTPLPAVGVATVHSLCHVDGLGVFAGNSRGQIHRWDGNAWELDFDLHLDLTILGMWATGAGDIFAVGDEGLILRRSAGIWKRMISGTKSALYSVWGLDGRHVLAGGDFGLILRWNGDHWKEFSARTDSALFGIWGDALDNIYVVGLSGTVSHFNGQRWSPLQTRTRSDLLAISGSPGKQPLIVGTNGTILRLDGDSWCAEIPPTNASLRSVTTCSEGNVWAVGDAGVVLKRQLDVGEKN